MEKQSVFIAIDLKSFYASVECRERRRDPLTTNLVVADKSRTEKTICLAVSPSLKSFGISGRARLFDVVLHHYKLTNFSNRFVFLFQGIIVLHHYKLTRFSNCDEIDFSRGKVLHHYKLTRFSNPPSCSRTFETVLHHY